MEIRRRPPNPTVRVENLEYAVPHREAQAKNILEEIVWHKDIEIKSCLLYTSPSPRDRQKSRMPSSA